jgi:endogenous inhibitor of DNA gyrase (YacG/DUF329 family)
MTGGKCPICGKPPSADDRPFCSARCRNVDLQRWFTGGYAIAVVDDEADPNDEDADD